MTCLHVYKIRINFLAEPPGINRGIIKTKNEAIAKKYKILTADSIYDEVVDMIKFL